MAGAEVTWWKLVDSEAAWPARLTWLILSRCWPRWTRSSGRSRWPPGGRCACWLGRAPARPGPSHTGSPTRQLTGVVDPRHVLALTFTTRAAGELRARVHQLAGRGGRAGPGAGPHVPLGRAAPAHPLLAAHRGRAAAHRAGFQGHPAGRGGPPPAGRGQPGRAARRGRGDRVGQGDGRAAGGLSGRGGPGRARRAAGPRAGGPALHRLRGAAPGAPPGGLRVGAGADRRHPGRAPGGGCADPRPVPVLRGR